MKSWVALLLNIQNVGSTLQKADYLYSYFKESSNQDKFHLINLFHTNLNYNINSYISDISKLSLNIISQLELNVNTNHAHASEKFFEDRIYFKISTGFRFKKQDWIDHLIELSSYCQSIPELHIYLKVITKSLNIGLSLKGFNKVMSRLIVEDSNKFNDSYLLPEFECMRASSLADCKIDFTRCFISVKKDGVNASCYNNSIFTRNGGSLLLPHIQDELASIFKDYAVFGELVSDTRQSSSGIVNSALKMGLDSKLPVHSLKLYVFDIMPIQNFNERSFEEYPFYKRVEILNSFKDGDNYKILDHKLVSSLDEVYALNDLYYNQGEEGVVANDYNGLFEFSRSKARAKIKAEIDSEFIITGYTLHRKNPQMLGAITVQSACGNITSNVGSGFTEEQRYEYLKDINNLIGKIVTIKYNDIDKKTNSLFLPVFSQIRFDKTEADSFES